MGLPAPSARPALTRKCRQSLMVGQMDPRRGGKLPRGRGERRIRHDGGNVGTLMRLRGEGLLHGLVADRLAVELALDNQLASVTLGDDVRPWSPVATVNLVCQPACCRISAQCRS